MFRASGGSAVTSRSAKRSEEHTSELQSLAYLVCRLLLEKKKRNRVDCCFAVALPAILVDARSFLKACRCSRMEVLASRIEALTVDAVHYASQPDSPDEM